MPSFTRALTFAAALPILALVVGCTASDKHDFYSTITQPTSVTLVDTYQGEEVWSMDIPVNHVLSLDFKGNAQGGGGSSISASSSVAWKLREVSDQPRHSGYGKAGKLLDSDTIDLTGKRVRMQISYRTSPELPGTLDAAPIPTRETAESVAAEAIAESKLAPQAKVLPDDQAEEPAEAVSDEEPAVLPEDVMDEVEAALDAEAQEAEAVEVEAEESLETPPTK